MLSAGRTLRFIPLDKSWTIRMGVLDLLNGYDDTIRFLKAQNELNQDSHALLNASQDWRSGKIEVHVGESGTLYRFLQFASWKLELGKRFVLEGTLRARGITRDHNIVKLGINDLLKLDNGTSQWASAAVLLGEKGTPVRMPPKLQLSYEAVKHWNERRKAGKIWKTRVDENIRGQARAFLDIKETGKTIWRPMDSEDYCFGRAFDMIDAKKGEVLWPQLHGHESDRIMEMEAMLNAFKNTEAITSKDHRVVQAIAMLSRARGKRALFEHPEVVGKSWPLFWEFLSKA